jgi:hypothetical protein
MSAEYKKLQRAKAILEGKCSRCCSRPAMKNRRYCRKCFEKCNPGFTPMINRKRKTRKDKGLTKTLK